MFALHDLFGRLCEPDPTYTTNYRQITIGLCRHNELIWQMLQWDMFLQYWVHFPASVHECERLSCTVTHSFFFLLVVECRFYCRLKIPKANWLKLWVTQEGQWKGTLLHLHCAPRLQVWKSIVFNYLPLSRHIPSLLPYTSWNLPHHPLLKKNDDLLFISVFWARGDASGVKLKLSANTISRCTFKD